MVAAPGSAVAAAPPGGTAPARRQPALRRRAGWPAARRTLTCAFLALLLYLLVTQARQIDWSEVLDAMRGHAPPALALAAGLAACSHALYAGFDLLGRRHAGHDLPARQVLGVTFVCYAFNLNLGSLVGAVALRYRLYSRLGLDSAVITHVPAGLGVLEAVFIALLGAQLPQHQLLAALLAYGAIYYLAPLLLAAALYFVMEARAKRRAGR